MFTTVVGIAFVALLALSDWQKYSQRIVSQWSQSEVV